MCGGESLSCARHHATLSAVAAAKCPGCLSAHCLSAHRAFTFVPPFLSLFLTHTLMSARLSLSLQHTHYSSLTHSLTLTHSQTDLSDSSLLLLVPYMFRLVHHIHVWRFRPNRSSHQRTSFRTRVNACCTDCYGMKGNMIWSGNEVSLVPF